MMGLDDLKWDRDGLVSVVVQDASTGEIRMLAHANREALNATFETGYAHFFSRSRQRLWCKGESSGHKLKVQNVWVDCDGDALIPKAFLPAPIAKVYQCRYTVGKGWRTPIWTQRFRCVFHTMPRLVPFLAAVCCSI